MAVKKRGNLIGIMAVLFLVATLGLTAGLVQQQTNLRSKAVVNLSVVSAYYTHPNYWKLNNTYDYVAKKYIKVEGSANPPWLSDTTKFPMQWIWSGPYSPGDNLGRRHVVYQNYVDNGSLLGTVYEHPSWPGGYYEWEMWQPKTVNGVKQAWVWNYGGRTEVQSPKKYTTKTNCLAGTNQGHIWPDSDYLDHRGRRGIPSFCHCLPAILKSIGDTDVQRIRYCRSQA